MNEIFSITPIDGRYKSKTRELSEYFSEFALMRYRVRIEIEYLIELSMLDINNFDQLEKSDILFLRSIYKQFSEEDCIKIKNHEARIKHDVKAVEYFIRDKIKERFPKLVNFVHFALTSQDINSTANMLSIKDGLDNVIIPNIENIQNILKQLEDCWADIPLLARTHGQAASPTKLGKEIAVYSERLYNQYKEIFYKDPRTKFGGATGNFNAHYICYPEIDWNKFADNFIRSRFNLKRNKKTTQIDHYDNYCEFFDILKRINTILIDLCGDMWLYISRNILKQFINKNEVGSSAMPHKVNPINFENAEGNFLLANNLFEFFSRNLPVSRLQRDLTDSTILRNIGVAFSYTLIGLKSLKEGLSKVEANKEAIIEELNNNYEVIAEAIQSKLKIWGFSNSYEVLKDLTRTNGGINKNVLDEFIDGLEIDEEKKNELKTITPCNYTGI